MNIKNMKIAQKLGLSFTVVICLLLVLTGLSFVRVTQLSTDIDIMSNDRYPKIVQAQTIKDELNEVARNMRNILLMTDASALEKEYANIEERTGIISKSMATLDKSIGTTKGRELLQAAINAREKFNPLRAGFLALTQDGKKEQALDLLYAQVRPAQREFMAALEKLIEFQSSLMAATAEETEQLASSTKAMILILAVVASVISILLAYFSSRSITRPLEEAVMLARKVADGDLSSQISVTSKDETGLLLKALFDMNQGLMNIVSNVRSGTDTIANASGEIANGNLDLSSRTEQQASSLEETAASLEELTSTVKQNSENARQANQLAKTASETAIKGGQVVADVVHTMDSISEASKKIVDIISVIDGIAFQTNILALNAAVEAARAGEQGRGFAVVASEVRNLAHRSASAAKEIKILINDTVGKVDAGSKQVLQAGTTMEGILTSVRHVTDIMEEISAASHEQEQGIEQINQAVTEMDTVTQQNAALVEEAAAAAGTMQEQAAHLAQLVSVFKLNEVAWTGPSNVVDIKNVSNLKIIRLDKIGKTTKVQAVTHMPKKRFAAAGIKSEEWAEF
ncbi:methyl-accepting chemotaxis protein [Undibacterium pigrum]|uniref:Methyl-accepting chemotaxis protein n=1 Tax=Undibacterium pigrum TaxID=401470 RepID=A0A318IVH6_9BURK|nr:methyl-accepting chemotaxis protein [Undibacterium pigrum]PXX37947.1 methyl-accepting chemotaxis protein [Undibacterium pigrum]